MLGAALAGVLLGKGRTQVLRGFRSKSGKKFSAALVLDGEGALKFAFDDSKPAAKPAATAEALACPRCREGTLIAGARGWGCSRWRDGCRFVVWFETAGRRLTAKQLRDLVTRGKTRKATVAAGAGRLVLDPTVDGGAARFEPY
jgi:DNA topoisomerase III